MSAAVKSYVKHAIAFGPDLVIETAMVDKALSDDEKAEVAKRVTASAKTMIQPARRRRRR